MNRSDDFFRYIEHLQRQLLTEGWDAAFDVATLRSWISSNLEGLATIAERYPLPHVSSPVQMLEQVVERFVAGTRYELPQTRSIFEPLLNEIRVSADRLGVAPVANVHIATSTDVGPSPIARAAQGQHLLFIGLGTSSFCNYWAKAYAAIVRSIPGQSSINTPEEVGRIFANNPNALILAARLALYYGFFGTTLGFGEILQPPDYLAYRLQLLSAMEGFAVGHEYAHLVAEEQLPRFRGQLTPVVANELETLCDRLGFQLSQHYGSRTDNFLAFTGVGALIFFRAMELSEAMRGMLDLSRRHPAQASLPAQDLQPLHPPYEERIATIRRLLDTTVAGQREKAVSFFEEYDRITIGVNNAVRRIIEEAVRR